MLISKTFLQKYLVEQNKVTIFAAQNQSHDCIWHKT